METEKNWIGIKASKSAYGKKEAWACVANLSALKHSRQVALRYGSEERPGAPASPHEGLAVKTDYREADASSIESR